MPQEKYKDPIYSTYFLMKVQITLQSRSNMNNNKINLTENNNSSQGLSLKELLLIKKAALNHPEAIGPLLDELISSERHAIFINLLSTLLYEPNLLESALIKGTSILGQSEQAKILKETTTGGWNLLFLAIKYQPLAILPLLNLIKSLNFPEQIKIFLQTTKKQCDVFMLAAKYQPDCLKLLVDALKFLPESEQKVILKQTLKNIMIFIAKEKDPEELKFLFHINVLFKDQKFINILNEACLTTKNINFNKFADLNDHISNFNLSLASPLTSPSRYKPSLFTKLSSGELSNQQKNIDQANKNISLS